MFQSDSILQIPPVVIEQPEIPAALPVFDHTESAENAETAEASVAEDTGEASESAEKKESKEKKRDESSESRRESSSDNGEDEEADSLHAVDSVTEVRQIVTVVADPPDWESGLEPIDRPGHTGHNQGVISLIVIIVLCLCLFFKNIRRVWNSLTKNLVNQRVEQPLEHNTDVERRTILFLLVVTIIFIALLASAGFSSMLPWEFRFDMATTMKMIGLVTAFFVFQYVAYWTVGYSFSTEEGRRRWIDGFTAAMTILGLALLLPGLAVLFYPAITMVAVYFAMVLYVLARIMFIVKGFRIFYTNSASIVYFILYLCSLEIVPVTIFFYLAYLLCSF